eukprot:Rhum_TRINITY_DN13765_c2_g1::Rhum_TRINITY_DN13765_c2_g1_i1::g.64038::m.64038
MDDSEIVIRPRICREFSDVRATYELGATPRGAGRHSEVYRAVHRQTGDVVAVKATKKKLRGIEHSVRKEMDALRAVESNPSIMKFVELLEDEQTFYAVLEWVGGDDLCERLSRRGGVMPEQEAALVIRALLTCVRTIHEHGIIHRDIKLTNVMFTSRERSALRLIDFGAAEVIKKDVDITKTVGTHKYLAPEMFGQRGYSKEVDMWAVGVVCFTLLTGVEPFPGHGPELVDR